MLLYKKRKSVFLGADNPLSRYTALNKHIERENEQIFK